MQQAASLWEQSLGDRLLGVYLLGSLAHGGFSRRYSDIDLALINKDELAPLELQALTSQVATQFPELTQPVSLFWANGNFSVGRFPPLDRIDYLDHAVALVEKQYVVPARPSLNEVRAYLSGEPLRRWSQEINRLLELSDLTPRDYKSYVRAILYVARFIYSWETGGIASNDAAVAFIDERKHFNSNIDLVQAALCVRQANDDPSLLLDQRQRLRSVVNFCRDFIER